MRRNVLTAAAVSGLLLADPHGSIAQSSAEEEAAGSGAKTEEAGEAAGPTGPKRIRVAREGGVAPAQAPMPEPRPEPGPVTLAAPATTVGPAAGRAPARVATYGLVGELVEETFSEEAEVEGDHLIQAALERDKSDLPEVRERGFLRLAVAPDPLMIAYHGERGIGIAMDLATELQEFLSERRTEPGTPTVVLPVPTPRGEIAERVEEGQADFASLVVGGRPEEFAFTQPLLTGVNDIVVLGPDAPEIESMEDMADVRIFVPEGSHYAEHLEEFNAARLEMGKEPFEVRHVDGRLKDHDLMEMLQIGVVPATVMADFEARFWSQIYPGVELRHDLKVSEQRDIAWAVRAENPELREELDAFAETVKEGTLIGNMLRKRYYGSTDWVEDLETGDEQTLMAQVEPVIQQYSEIYGFESDLVLAQAYQESQLDQARRSHVGAIGVMQVMPTTAADPVVGIPDVTKLESNVEAGIKYLRWLRDTYYSEPEVEPLDQTLFSLAAYNAGPGGMQRARARAREMGLDPNVWFENVEVAITRAVSQEPAIYVRNIFKYYVSYRLLHELEAERQEARATLAEVAPEVERLPPEQKIEVLQQASILVEEDEESQAPSDEPDRRGARFEVAPAEPGGPASRDAEGDRAPLEGPRFRRP